MGVASWMLEDGELIVRRSLNIVINTMFTCGAHNVERGTKWERGNEGGKCGTGVAPWMLEDGN